MTLSNYFQDLTFYNLLMQSVLRFFCKFPMGQLRVKYGSDEGIWRQLPHFDSWKRQLAREDRSDKAARFPQARHRMFLSMAMDDKLDESHAGELRQKNADHQRGVPAAEMAGNRSQSAARTILRNYFPGESDVVAPPVRFGGRGKG
jgi:hypothetical protein